MNQVLPISSGEGALSAVEMVTLEQVDKTRFRSIRNQDNRVGAIFGGQALCHGLMAAQATVPGWMAHSLAGNFMRSGSCDLPVDYDVEVLRDGRSYAARRVLASQAGRPIFDCISSFHAPEDGPDHQIEGIDDVPPPDSLIDMVALAQEFGDRMPPIMRRSFALPFPVELRMVDPHGVFEPGKMARRDFWFRVRGAGSVSDAHAHHGLLAFASDYWLAGAVAIPHPSPVRSLSVASLNHSMWFHAPVRVDDWLLYRTSSPWAAQGRGLAHGQIFDLGGRLVASTSQEASLRKLPA